MKTTKILAWIAFFGAVFTPIVAMLTLASYVGSFAFYYIAELIRYAWVVCLFIPIEALSLILGRILKQKGMQYIQNIAVPAVMIPFLLLMGSFSILFANHLSYETSYVTSAEKKIVFDLPENIDVITNKYILTEDSKCAVSYVKILSQEEQSHFERTIQNSPKWTKHLSSTLKNSLPREIQVMLVAPFDYFLYFNSSTREFNKYPFQEGIYDCIFLAYNCSDGQLILLSDYCLTVN